MNNLFKTSKHLRKQLIIWLFQHSQRIYTAMFKHHESWNISKSDLLKMPQSSFGKHLGDFLDKKILN